MKNFYIGQKKIKGTLDSGKKTPLGDMIYEVLLEDDKKILMSAKRLELSRSDKPFDLTAARDNFIKPVASLVYGMLHEYGLQIGEVGYLCQVLATLTQDGINRSNQIRWSVEDEESISLNAINEFLMEQHAKKNKDGASS